MKLVWITEGLSFSHIMGWRLHQHYAVFSQWPDALLLTIHDSYFLLCNPQPSHFDTFFFFLINAVLAPDQNESKGPERHS